MSANNKSNIKLLLLIFLSFIIGNLETQAQDTINFKTVNDKTFEYYVAQNWDSLIIIGNLGLHNSIDYSYLRSRLGVAYFQKQNYVKAIEHFQKAIQLSGDDAFLIEYLYYCYLSTGRRSDANYLTKTYPDIFKDKVNPLFIDEVYIDAGITQSPDVLKKIPENADTLTQWTESGMTNRINYGGAGIKCVAGKNLMITSYYGYLNIENTKKIRIGSDSLTDNYKLYQNQFYINFSRRIGNGALFIPAFHFLLVDFATVASSYDENLEKVMLSRKTISIQNMAISLAFDKKFSYFGINIFSSFSNLNKSTQKQAGATFSAFPSGNLNLYSLSTITLHNEKSVNNFVIEEKAGCKVFNYLWVDGFVSMGEMKNYVEQNAFVVFNMNEAINFRYGGSLIIPIKNLKITLKYQYNDLLSNYSYYQKDVKTGELKNNSQQFLISLTWKISGKAFRNKETKVND